MDQIKIGMFIAEIRKEKGLTQKQLAEAINVSDKTISKWECGNGLPEMSNIPVLCEALEVNMNELLSGERLLEETYSKKAEENMMALMKETEKQKKNGRNSLITLILCLLGVIMVLILSVSFGTTSGTAVVIAFLDIPSLIMLVVPVMFILAGAGLFKEFFKAFAILGKGTDKYIKLQLDKAGSALRLGANSIIITGILESVALTIYLFGYYQQDMPVEVFLANIAVAMLSSLYGLIIYLLLLPVRSRLDLQNELEK